MNEKTVRDIWNGRTWFRETRSLSSVQFVSDSLERRPGRPKGAKDVQPRRRRHFEFKDTDDVKYKGYNGGKTSSAAASVAGNEEHCEAFRQKSGPMGDDGETKLGLSRRPDQGAILSGRGGGGGCVLGEFAESTLQALMEHGSGLFFSRKSSNWCSSDNSGQASMPQESARWRFNSAGGAGGGGAGGSGMGGSGFAECCQLAAGADSPWVQAVPAGVDLHRRPDSDDIRWASGYYASNLDNSKAKDQTATDEPGFYVRPAEAARRELTRGDINALRRGRAQPDVGGDCHPPDSFAAVISTPSQVRAAVGLPLPLLYANGCVLAPPARPSFGSEGQKDASAASARSNASLAVIDFGRAFWRGSSPTLREDLSAAGAHFKKDDGVEDDPFHDDWAYWPKPPEEGPWREAGLHL